MRLNSVQFITYEQESGNFIVYDHSKRNFEVVTKFQEMEEEEEICRALNWPPKPKPMKTR